MVLRAMEHFADNFERLLGLHKLSGKEAADMLGLSQSVLSKWQSGARQPSFSSALTAGDFFGVPADRLARADFSDLLANELADTQRYADVEAEIRRRRTKLREVGDTKMLGKSKPEEEDREDVPEPEAADKTPQDRAREQAAATPQKPIDHSLDAPTLPPEEDPFHRETPKSYEGMSNPKGNDANY